MEQPTSTKQSKPKRKMYVSLQTIRLVLGIVILLTLGAGLGYRYREYQWEQDRTAFRSQLGPNATLSRDELDFSMFWDVWDTLQENYLEPDKIEPQQLIYGAIEGMTSAVGDPYTVFLPPTKNQQSKEDLNGEFSGVGIQLGFKRDTLAVIAPLDGHPAIEQGVMAGDLILHITDEANDVDVDTTDLTLPEAVRYIRGRKGTSVTLKLFREARGTFDVTITRDTITIPSVELTIGDFVDGEFEEDDTTGKIAWIKVRRFGDRTQAEWDTALREINSSRDRLSGVVLDVRNNPGGLLRSAISLASDFIPEGVVVTQEGRFETESYDVDRRGRLIGMPVVVLINGGSASASEILAGALRDRIDAPLVGVRSFGKGTVQEALELDSGAGLHVTTSRWLLPSGDWIHDDGLEPTVMVDITVDPMATESAQVVDTQLETATNVLIQGLDAVLASMPIPESTPAAN